MSAPIPDEDLGPGLQAKHRYLYPSFSFGGDRPDSAYGEGHTRTFGQKPSKYCDRCERLKSWCECKELT